MLKTTGKGSKSNLVVADAGEGDGGGGDEVYGKGKSVKRKNRKTAKFTVLVRPEKSSI